MILTPEKLKAITPTLKSPKLEATTNALVAAMAWGKIDNPICQAMLIAQIAHESGSFFYSQEIASGEAYEGRKDLGNTSPGDGVKYKGRGWIQVTGKANYAAISKDFGVDFVADPVKLALPEYCAKSAVWFWNKRGLSAIALPNTDDAFKEVTRRINGGYNHLAERHAFWVLAKVQFGV